jgi:hypothetical protein
VAVNGELHGVLDYHRALRVQALPDASNEVVVAVRAQSQRSAQESWSEVRKRVFPGDICFFQIAIKPGANVGKCVREGVHCRVLTIRKAGRGGNDR